MKKLSVLALAAGLTLTPLAPAMATPTPPPSLAEHMNDDQDSVWDKLQSWLESWHDAQHAEPGTEPTTPPTTEPTTPPTTPPTTEPTTPAPSPEPTQDTSPKITAGEVKWTEAGLTFDGKISNVPVGTRIQLRADTAPLEGQRGKYEYELTTTADGAVKITMVDYQGVPHDKLYWTLHKGGTELTDGTPIAKGEATKPAAPAPEPTPTTPPATGTGDGTTTGGSGGSKTDQLNQPFAADGLSKDYHIFAGGLDWSKPVGLLVYADGTGGYGFDNPNATYLLDADGTQGLVATAKKHNLLLVVPNAPGKSCDGGDNCWFDNKAGGVTETTVAEAEAKARWSDKLITKVKGQYDLDNSRVVIGGYSSGAQWTSRYFAPRHAESQSVDLAIPIAYGGDPAGADPTWSEAYKDDIKMSWDTGKNDAAYSTSSWAAIGGYNWYTNYLGAEQTDYLWPDGIGHSRSGQFAGIVDREITQHLK